MLSNNLKYKCKVCDYKCANRSKIDSHKLSHSHAEKCTAFNLRLREESGLFHKLKSYTLTRKMKKR